MSYRERMEQNAPAWETRVQSALERAPEVTPPVDFAARVAASLPPLKPARKPMRLGRSVALVSIGVAALAMFLLAPISSPSFSSVAFDLELVLLLQMAGIGYWLTVRANR